MTRHSANAYLKRVRAKAPLAPKMIVSKNGNYRYYDPVKSVTNGTTRPRWIYENDNKGEDYDLLSAACHLKQILGWDLHHIKPVSKEGSCHVDNLCLLPRSVNVLIGVNDWSINQINEVIQSLPEFARKDLGLSSDFRVQTLKDFVASCHEILTPSEIEIFNRRVIY